MPLQLRRGTDNGRLSITPVTGELIYVTDTKQVFVGDGTTVGGIPIGGGGAGYVGSRGPLGYTGSAVPGPLGYTGSAGPGFTGSAGLGFTGSTGAMGYTGSVGTGTGAPSRYSGADRKGERVAPRVHPEPGQGRGRGTRRSRQVDGGAGEEGGRSPGQRRMGAEMGDPLRTGVVP